jgi:hypothetical protein
LINSNLGNLNPESYSINFAACLLKAAAHGAAPSCYDTPEVLREMFVTLNNRIQERYVHYFSSAQKYIQGNLNTWICLALQVSIILFYIELLIIIPMSRVVMVAFVPYMSFSYTFVSIRRYTMLKIAVALLIDAYQSMYHQDRLSPVSAMIPVLR